MHVEPDLLPKLLSLTGLVLCAIEYGFIVRRRVDQHRREAESAAVHASGLQGLVRVLLTD